ncbi:MAG: transcription antitermination factor NusB [Chloroflexi bacterium]|nr:transcription antitermination factor NusB [Chloroflexota bacterium]MDA1146661.1 transcription antitermination factor NusB [Chloroflexota bacterium]MQC82796.1 transcription antitermination factor NusB [Chloroflexota bacterium]
MSSSSRRSSRILAFQVLFEGEQHVHPIAEALARRLDDSDLDADARGFARSLVEGVEEHRETIDEVISRHAPAFPLSEMAPVDRNVLRLAIYEVLFDNRGAPLRVAINEAVEIAKGYGSESSGRFVNGVLGAVALEAAERNESANHGSAPS